MYGGLKPYPHLFIFVSCLVPSRFRAESSRIQDSPPHVGIDRESAELQQETKSKGGSRFSLLAKFRQKAKFKNSKTNWFYRFSIAKSEAKKNKN
jgi:hypothetical protein